MRSGTPSSPSGELLAGRYRVAASIGRGRSTVYRAEDTRLKRQVAVKEVRLFDGHEDHTRVRRRAMREAHATARLNNPHVVTVFDVVEAEESIWLVMELVDAPSLAQLVADQGALDHAQAARIALAMLDALEAAHTEGVVHRDVKPANVLVDSEGHTKLADFGVATIRDETRVTATGMVVGSPAYMSPEQARGEPVGPATDLWGLGATLYYAVEGAPPFEGSTALATASAVVHGEPRPAQRQGPLTSIIFGLLEKDPTRRPTAPQLRQALTRAAGGARRRRRSWFLPRSAHRTDPPGAGDAAPAPAVPVVGAPSPAASPPAATTPSTDRSPAPATPAESPESTAVQPTKPDQTPAGSPASPPASAAPASPGSTAPQPKTPGKPPQEPTSPTPAAETAPSEAAASSMPRQPASTDEAEPTASAPPSTDLPSWLFDSAPDSTPPDDEPAATPPDEQPTAASTDTEAPAAAATAARPEAEPAAPATPVAPAAESPPTDHADTNTDQATAKPAADPDAGEPPTSSTIEAVADEEASATSPTETSPDPDLAAEPDAGEPLNKTSAGLATGAGSGEPSTNSTVEAVAVDEPSAKGTTATSPDVAVERGAEPTDETAATGPAGDAAEEPASQPLDPSSSAEQPAAGLTATDAQGSEPTTGGDTASAPSDVAAEPDAESPDTTPITAASPATTERASSEHDEAQRVPEQLGAADSADPDGARAGGETEALVDQPASVEADAESPDTTLTTAASPAATATADERASAEHEDVPRPPEQVDVANSGDLDGPAAGAGTEALVDQSAPVEAESEPPDTTPTTAASPTATATATAYERASAEHEDALRAAEQVDAADSGDLDGPTAGGGTEPLGDQAAPVEADSEPPDTTSTTVASPAATELASSEDEDGPRAAEPLGGEEAPSALASEPVTESASDLPATERATTMPATEPATAVPATERASALPAAEPATAVPAATERASALDDAAAADGAGERSSSVGGATSATRSRAARPGGRWGALKPAERQGLLAAVVLVVLLVVGLVAWRVGAGGDGDDDGAQAGRDGASQEETTSTAPSTTAADPTDEEEGEGAGDAPEESSTTTTEATTATTQPAAESGVPDGWVEYRHPEAGYTIAHPPGWQVVPAGGPRVDLEEPGTGTYLRIDWTAQPRPDPVADWRTQAGGFAGSHEAYQEIRIEPFRYRDYNAAIWEFTYRDGGVDLHAANLGFVAGSRGYALFFQTHADRWAASQELFEQFRASFRPAP